MKVALVKAPNIGNITRGTGFYYQQLGVALRENEDVSFVARDVSYPVFDPRECDIVHFCYFDPFFLTLPLVFKSKVVVSVFDFIPFLFPGDYPPGVRGSIKWEIQKIFLKSADHIITISEASRRDIIKILGIPEDKITVTYLAAGPEYKKLNIPRDNFILYIGDINPNKNLITLFRALSLLKNERLVMIGKTLSENRQVQREIESLGLSNRVTLTGFIDEKEKVKLINQARVYVQPSIYEGFGLPVLEALKCGTPVVCGNNSSLPEIVGDAATFADVLNPNELAEKIRNAKPTGREVSQAQKFSWEKTARETINVYEKIIRE